MKTTVLSAAATKDCRPRIDKEVKIKAARRALAGLSITMFISRKVSSAARTGGAVGKFCAKNQTL
jgi:hypothetical protein